MKFKYLDEHRKFIEKNCKGITTAELAELFNEQFKTDITRNQIKCYFANHRLTNGLGGQFKKGHIPVNKGTKGIMKSNKTSFVKGHIPGNYRPVGSERITRDGYIEIKICDPNKWVLKHNFIYEKEFGKVPKGHALFFLDQNRQNVDINNLALITRQELAFLNKELKASNNRDINKTKLLIARIKAKCSNLNKEVQKNENT